MTSKYTNKNGGKKLLAVILMMALACAGCVLVLGSDESSATDIEAPTALTDVTEAPSTILLGGSYKVTSDKTVTIVTGNVDMTFYVANGVTLTLKGVENHSGTVTVCATDADAAYQIANDTNITIGAFTGGEITVKAAYSGSSKVASSFEITGKPVATSVTITLGTITVGESSVPAGTVSVGPSGFNYGTSGVLANLTYGSCSFKNGSAYSYTQPNTNQSYTLQNSGASPADKVLVLSGTVTITDGTNTVKFTKYQSADISKPVAVTGPATGSETTISGGDAKDTGSITILKEKIKASSLASISSTFTGVSNGTYIMAQIGADGEYTVYGDYEQKKSFEDGVTSITLDPKASFVIPENVAMTITTISLPDKTAFKVFGNATITNNTGSGVLQVGPYGTLNVATGEQNTNVKDGPDNGRNGELSGVIGDVILTGESYVPAGKTLTVTGKVGLNGQKMTVEGKLIIDDGAVIYSLGTSDLIILGQTGSIENNGVFGTIKAIKVADSDAGTNGVTVNGVDGIQFGYVSVDGNKVLSISGDVVTSGIIKTGTSATGTIVMIGNASIGGNLSVGEGITLTGVAGTAASENSVIDVEGVFSGVIVLQAGASISVSGTMDLNAEIKAVEGQIDGSGKVAGEVSVKITDDEATGITVYSQKSKTDVKVYVAGDVQDANVTPSNTESTVTITGIIYVPVDGLIVAKEVQISVENVILEGVMQKVWGTVDGSDITVTDYIGATYVVESGTSANKITIEYYSDVESAVAAIDTAKDKTVSVTVIDFIGNAVIGKGQTLDVTISGEIKKGSSITANDGSTLGGTVETVTGSVVVYNGATNTVSFSNEPDSSIESSDKVTYAGFETAVEMVDAGETLTVGNVITESDLIVKEGVTVVADNLTVKGNLTIPESSTLKADIINMIVSGKKVIVNGILDLSEGNITGNYTLISPGTTILSSIDTAKMSGAYYTTETGYVLTTVAKAAEQATEGEVVVIGTDVKESGNIVLDGITLRVSAEEASLGNIVILDGAKVIAQGALTATITDAVPETLGAVTSSVSVDGTTVTVTGSEDGLQINALNGKVKVLSGVVTVTGVINNTAEFTVSNGAQAIIAGDLNLTGGVLDVQGDLAVRGKLVVTTIVPKLVGTLTALTGSTVEVVGLDVQGSLVAQTNSTVSTEGVITVEDGAVISGKITTNSTYVKAYAGSDVSGLVKTGLKFTAFYVNDDLVETIYTSGTVGISGLQTDLKADIAKEIPGVAVPAALDWKTADGSTIINVGGAEALYVTIGYGQIAINVSIQSGTELRIGTDYYRSTGATEEIYYLETPYTVTATDIAGDKSVIVEFYVNDVKQVITGNQVTFTADMASKKIVILSAYGTTPVDPETPAEPATGFDVYAKKVDGKVQIRAISDDGYFQDGTLTITLSYTYYDDFAGDYMTDSVDVPYEYISDEETVDFTYELEIPTDFAYYAASAVFVSGDLKDETGAIFI